MYKKSLPVIAILLLLVGGYGAYRVYKHFKRVSAPIAAVQTQTAANNPTSLKDLIAKGTSQSCTFTEKGTTGTIYITGGKVRGDFESNIDGQSTKSHIIDMDNTSYIWSDGQKTGFKTSFNPNETPEATAKPPEAGTSSVLDTNASMDYKCGAWISDETMFNLPAGVTFSTFAMPTSTK